MIFLAKENGTHGGDDVDDYDDVEGDGEAFLPNSI